jgi:hypothetical protein
MASSTCAVVLLPLLGYDLLAGWVLAPLRSNRSGAGCALMLL